MLTVRNYLLLHKLFFCVFYQYVSITYVNINYKEMPKKKGGGNKLWFRIKYKLFTCTILRGQPVSYRDRRYCLGKTFF